MHRKPRIIGYRKNGSPIWLIMGGSGEGDTGDTGGQDEAGEGATDDDGDGEDGDRPLGPKGEKALAAEKERRRAAQAELREWKQLGVKPSDLAALLAERNRDGDDSAPDPDAIRRQAVAEARAELARERVADKIQVGAARKFADPDDAAALVLRGRTADDFLDDGQVDVEAIQEALDELLKKKPYLAAQGGRRFSGSADGGAREDKQPDPGPGLARMRAAYERSAK